MEMHSIAKTSEISDLNPLIVKVKGLTIGIYRFKDKYYAYENECAHEGGPVIEGKVIGDVRCRISPQGRKLGEYFSETEMDIICPWHGIQYDLMTGICRGDGRMKLKAHVVIVDGDYIKIEM